MCNQSVGLIQRAVEATGISTVSITLDENITKRVKPPRALSVPYRFGYPLGAPNNPELQHAIIAEALAILADEETPPILKSSNFSILRNTPAKTPPKSPLSGGL